MKKLYPLKFAPILKNKIWGGKKLNKVLHKSMATNNCGESWEISGVEGDISYVSNGFLEGNNLHELIEVYMGDLVGNAVYDKFGQEFPLLIKYIDANDVLSVQVHPNDEQARERHNSYGKTEMWYVLETEGEASIINGFNKNTNVQEYEELLAKNELLDILNTIPVSKNDSFFIPAGRIHAIGKGVLLAEIQQTSDITYRIYDFNRTDKSGKTRELHTELAKDVINYQTDKEYKINYTLTNNETANLARCKYFTTNILEFSKTLDKDMVELDSFVIYMGIEGNTKIQYNESDIVTLNKGESVLIPAELKNYQLIPEKNSKILEVYIQDVTED